MRVFIKIILAIAFMIVAFFVGGYFSEEKCADQLKQVHKIAKNDKAKILQLRDSITFLQENIVKVNYVRKKDSMDVANLK